MGITPPLRYIHIDDYAPCGIDNGPDDAAFANARADLAAFGYHMLVVGTKQYWLQNGFNLNSYTDYNGTIYPALTNVLITSDSFSGGVGSSYGICNGLPGTIILSPRYADLRKRTYFLTFVPYKTDSATLRYATVARRVARTITKRPDQPGVFQVPVIWVKSALTRPS